MFDLGEIILFVLFIVYLFIEKLLIPSQLEKVKEEILKELEKVKSSFSKEEFIHRLKFEKEFKINCDIWEALVKFKDSTARLNLPFKAIPESKAEKETRREKLIELTNHMGILRDILENNRPFYGPEVKEKTWEIIAIAIDHIQNFYFPGKDVDEYLSDAADRVDQINSISCEVEKAISKIFVVTEHNEKNSDS